MAALSSQCDAVAFVIFGVTGDLTRRKLVPALYELMRLGKLPMPMHIIGFARRPWSDDELQEILHQGVADCGHCIPLDENAAAALLQRTYYVQSTFDDPVGYMRLKTLIQELGVPNVVYYLATPPDAYSEIIHQIGAHDLKATIPGWTRVVIEKPYGNDLESAVALEKRVHEVFEESQIYRIDHYLGKETVQNILVLRFANGIFEPLWNRSYIDHVQITVAETNGVGTRGGYYDSAGVIRDMFQNHLLQLLTLTAMEAPVAFNADAVRDEKVKVLRALRPLQGHQALTNTYRGQYAAGVQGGVQLPGYRQEENVTASSTTETYLAARLYVDNWRWAGVPFYLRSGKRLPARITEIAIQFKQAPLSLFNWHNMAGEAPNVLVLNLQPDEGITLTFGAKGPGPGNQILPVRMAFSYQESFGSEPPEAYERLLLDCLMGDATLFTRSDEVNAQWAFTTGIIRAWQDNPVASLPEYKPGSWGAPGVDEFIQHDHRRWRTPLKSG